MSHAGLHKPAARPAVVYLCGAISGMPAAGPVRRDLRQGGALPVGARYFVVAEGKKGLGRRLHLAAGWHNCTIRGLLLLAVQLGTVAHHDLFPRLLSSFRGAFLWWLLLPFDERGAGVYSNKDVAPRART